MNGTSAKLKTDYQVSVVGGGPVGLYLGICLRKAGISSCVLEKSAKPVTHSRSIGIHPVVLERFQESGLASLFIEKGIKVTEGVAFWEAQKAGTLSFKHGPPPFRFILTLPQHQTEKILTDYIKKIAPSALKRKNKVVEIEEGKEGVLIKIEGNVPEVTADYVVGCDGMHSLVRKSAGISFNGKEYDDTYAMGDFTDNTDLGRSAGVFLGRNGLVESFPLPNNIRRWVVKTDEYIEEMKREAIEVRVKNRTGISLKKTENSMLSSFRVYNKRAETLAQKRVLLAGDAAHVVSPIGGQGMNLGWLDAYYLSQCFKQIFTENDEADKVLKRYSRRRLKIARRAAKRAAFNMALGRKAKYTPLKKWLLKAVVTPPFSRKMARIFTMRGLDQ